MTSTTLVVLAVVAYEGRYLVVEERDGTFYLPAGRVEPGENLMAAAVRETAPARADAWRPAWPRVLRAAPGCEGSAVPAVGR